MKKKKKKKKKAWRRVGATSRHPKLLYASSINRHGGDLIDIFPLLHNYNTGFNWFVF